MQGKYRGNGAGKNGNMQGEYREIQGKYMLETWETQDGGSKGREVDSLRITQIIPLDNTVLKHINNKNNQPIPSKTPYETIQEN